MAKEHLLRAKFQRQHFQSEKERAKSEQNLLVLSFDYAQKIPYSASPQTVGIAFFKAARKLGFFGINNAKNGVQHIYIIDEAHMIGKDPNTVISMHHNFVENKEQVDKLVQFAHDCQPK